MVKINLKALDRDIFIQGDDAVARTIQIGQSVTVNDVVVIDSNAFAVTSAGNARFGASSTGTLACGNATITGTLAVSSTAAIEGNLACNGGITANSTVTSSNTTIGSSAGGGSGGNNVAIGASALSSATTCAVNTCIGVNAGDSLTTGGANTFIGKDSGQGPSTATNCIAIGFAALQTANSDSLLAIGASAMRYSNGANNMAFGTNALLGNNSGTPHTGEYNIAIGANALTAIEGNTWNNIAIGGASLQNLTTGIGNTCIGRNTGNDVTTGASNVFIGNSTGDAVTTGSSNILIGSGLDTDAVSSTGQLKINYAGGSNVPLISGDMVAGHAGINTEIANQDATLHVTTDTGDGIPCLELQQDSVAEPFIELDATSAASVVNPLTSWTTGNTIQGHFRISVNGTDRWVPFYDAPTS